jgi:hypothetical protein
MTRAVTSKAGLIQGRERQAGRDPLLLLRMTVQRAGRWTARLKQQGDRSIVNHKS